MRLLFRDLISVNLVKMNGEIYEGIKVNLQSQANKLLTQEFNIPFEEGDFIERKLKNGVVEKYVILKIDQSSNVINMDIQKNTDLTADEKNMGEQKKIINNTNNFYDKVTGVQIQQGTNNSSQEQTVMQEFDYDKLTKILEQIKKYDSTFDNEYGEKAPEIRSKIDEIETLLQKRENPSRIKILLADIKNLSIGVAGSLIASGIISLVSAIV
ncbi:MAG: hypothetical protein HFG37_12065 [Eubacterium sp.]|nr:hypothetical protein [Eubacterium sp.]